MSCESLWSCVAAPLEFGFMQRGLAAAVLIAVLCAVIGAFVVQQELAFIGDALAHASFPGVVVAYMLGFNLALGGALVGILTALGVGAVTRHSKLSQDTAIGVLFAGTFALGVALLSTVKNYTKDLFGLLLGDVLAVRAGDVLVIAGLGALMLLIVFALYKELTLLVFDPVQAEVIGLPVQLLRELLLALMAVTIVIAIQTVGIVLVVAMLVTPAATATLLVRRFPMVMLLGAIQGALGALAGLYLSFYFSIASGATIVLVLTSMFVLALVVAPRWRRTAS
ncbi:MAG TPA: metal ABC transporter permease [Kouleothrix sp.]|uniref:metal ABC transporter permease n=1 Tax=Kouleothrix sp. TaxID=2779161 RepID=UPI002C270704|nr:metal ABC transporter permease [Kouleothrix sp.]HRC78063.1 metal ABC transporter permease [Kouleothrix sp.]